MNFSNRKADKICGIEITEKDLSTIKNSINNPKTEFKIGSAIDIPYPESYFDTVVSWEVIEHIPVNTELTMFNEVSRIFRPNGVFYLSTPYRHLISNILDPACWLIGYRHYTKSQLSEYAFKSGLKVERIVVKGGVWSLFALLNMYISKWIFKRGPFFRKFFAIMDNKGYTTDKQGIFNIFVKYRKI